MFFIIAKPQDYGYTQLFIIASIMWQYGRQALEDIDLGDLRANQAYLNITSHQDDRLWMYTLSEDCIRVSVKE